MYCKKCLRSTNIPFVDLDAEGLCGPCADVVSGKSAGKILTSDEKFERLTQNVPGSRHKTGASYDVMMAFSGGKDSTVALEWLTKGIGAKVLAYTSLEPWGSAVAEKNRKRIISKLGVDHMVMRPDASLMRNVMRQVLLTWSPEKAKASRFAKLHPDRALRMFTYIGCAACSFFRKTPQLKLAVDMRIPYICSGFDADQMLAVGISSLVIAGNEMKDHFMRGAGSFEAFWSDVIWDAVKEVYGDEYDNSLYDIGNTENYKDKTFPALLLPIPFIQRRDPDVRKRAIESGLMGRDDSDPRITNCDLVSMFDAILTKRYGPGALTYSFTKLANRKKRSKEEAEEDIECRELVDGITYSFIQELNKGGLIHDAKEDDFNAVYKKLPDAVKELWDKDTIHFYFNDLVAARKWMQEFDIELDDV